MALMSGLESMQIQSAATTPKTPKVTTTFTNIRNLNPPPKKTHTSVAKKHTSVAKMCQKVKHFILGLAFQVLGR